MQNDRSLVEANDRLQRIQLTGVEPEHVLHAIHELVADVDPETVTFEQVEANILKGVSRMTDEGRPSTGQDILKGRRTEIDFLNGLVAEKGDEAGVPTPTHKALVQVVKEVEKHEVEPSPGLVDRVWKLSGIQPLAVAQPAR